MVKELFFVKIVDLDQSPCNKIVRECSPDKPRSWECPHHIVTSIIKIVHEELRRIKLDEESPALQQRTDMQKLIKNQHQELLAAICSMKEEIREIKAKQ